MKMNRKRKIVIAAVAVLVLAAVVGISVSRSRQDAVTVQAETIKRRPTLDARVSANGEVRPINFYNLQAEVAGRILKIMVREGDLVKKGTPLLSLDTTQIAADAASSQATLQAARADFQNTEVQARAAENNIFSAQALLAAAKYDLERTRSDVTFAEEEYKRQQTLIEQGVTSRSVFEAARNRYEAARALLRAQESRVEQTESQLRDSRIRVDQIKTQVQSAKARVAQAEAAVRSSLDRLQKTTQYAPIDGVVANLPIHEGEFALASFNATPLMMIADMAEVIVEVQVDETDVTHVQTGQSAKVKVDAIVDKELEGIVAQVGQAPVTKSGQVLGALSGTSSEAKDFKVVIKLVNLTEEVRTRLRPGMSATAVVTTDTRENVVVVPLQALVQRDPSALETEKKDKPKTVAAAGRDNKPNFSEAKKEIQGVFVVQGDRAVFRPVQTGIIGETDIEITSGLEENTEIIVGPYRELRTLKNNAVIKKEASATATATQKDKK